MTHAIGLFTPLQLPNGLVLPNRIAKAAMEENLCDADHAPGSALRSLYARWATGGSGLIITGNVMIDRRAMTGAGGVVLENARHLDRFAAWADAARVEAGKVFMQLNHPGRQVMANLANDAKAPSAVPLRVPGLEKAFATPVAMTEAEIAEVIERFARTAALAHRAGFDGVQIHAAHGYLINQFLSPLANLRTDQWGGELHSRARLLLEVVSAVRAAVPASFCVAVKLNSTDFQRGGFSPEDARQVLEWLNALPVDLVELSGGNYESPAMRGHAADEQTLAREAYFLHFARELTLLARMPLMVTGGIRRLAVAQQVLSEGIDVVGMATALAAIPNLPQRWESADAIVAPEVFVPWRNKALASAAASAIVKVQLDRLSQDQRPGRARPAALALLCQQVKAQGQARRYRKWLQAQQK